MYKSGESILESNRIIMLFYVKPAQTSFFLYGFFGKNKKVYFLTNSVSNILLPSAERHALALHLGNCQIQDVMEDRWLHCQDKNYREEWVIEHMALFNYLRCDAENLKKQMLLKFLETGYIITMQQDDGNYYAWEESSSLTTFVGWLQKMQNSKALKL